MRVFSALFVLATVSLGSTACDETLLGRTPDPSPQPDMGMGFEGLPLQVGDSFVYEATLTRRIGPGTEENTQYQIRLTVTDVLDGGPDAVSEVSYEAEAERPIAELASRDWVPQFDADSWVAQLGPTQRSDAIANQPTSLTLEGAPSMPTGPKQIPSPSTFFVDLRFPSEIQSEWGTTAPTAEIDFTVEGGGLRLSSVGVDEDISFHEMNQLRRLELRYDDRGVLERMDETIGETTMFPNSRMILRCIEGCT